MFEICQFAVHCCHCKPDLKRRIGGVRLLNSVFSKECTIGIMLKNNSNSTEVKEVIDLFATVLRALASASSRSNLRNLFS